LAFRLVSKLQQLSTVIDDILKEVRVQGDERREEKSVEQQFIAFPDTGRKVSIPSGRLNIDLVNGLAIHPALTPFNLSGDLARLGADTARSAYIFADSPVTIELLMSENRRVPRLLVEQFAQGRLLDTPFRALAINSDVGYNLMAIFGTAAEAQFVDVGPQGYQIRIARAITTRTFNRIRWIPIDVDKFDGNNTESLGGPFSFTLGDTFIRAPKTANKVFLVHNVGLNDAVVRIRGRHMRNAREVTDLTGEVTVTSRNNNLIQTDISYGEVTMEVRDDTAGSSTIIEVQYLGQSVR